MHSPVLQRLCMIASVWPIDMLHTLQNNDLNSSLSFHQNTRISKLDKADILEMAVEYVQRMGATGNIIISLNFVVVDILFLNIFRIAPGLVDVTE